MLEEELRRSDFYPAGEKTSKTMTLDKFLPPTANVTFLRPIVGERRRGFIGLGGGVSDAYCPTEKEYRLARKCLKILADFRFPVHIITKSDLVVRDLDIQTTINKDTRAMVSFSFSTVDEEIKRVLEPRSSPVQKRLDAMVACAKEGITTGATYMPVIPYVTDSDEQIRQTLEAVKNHGGSYYLFGGMTLKGGRQVEKFYRTIDAHFPDKREQIVALYQKGWAPPPSYTRPRVAVTRYWGEQIGLAARAPRYFPPGEFSKNLEISTGLFNMAYFLWELNLHRPKSKAFATAALFVENFRRDLSVEWAKGVVPHEQSGSIIFPEIDTYLKTTTFPSWEACTSAYKRFLPKKDV
ncbi:MAG: radical SAM domain-containing protein [Promethearchaeota archaeon CR_4]|nr:MAG: radical SAM domain-containing protein [Candidatus Lokiarchaeota archaeon CR_4]